MDNWKSLRLFLLLTTALNFCSAPWVCKPNENDILNKVCLSNDDSGFLNKFSPEFRRFILNYWLLSQQSNQPQQANAFDEMPSLTGISSTPQWLGEELRFENFPEGLNRSNWLRSPLQRVLLWRKLYKLLSSTKASAAPVFALPVAAGSPVYGFGRSQGDKKALLEYFKKLGDKIGSKITDTSTIKDSKKVALENYVKLLIDTVARMKDHNLKSEDGFDISDLHLDLDREDEMSDDVLFELLKHSDVRSEGKVTMSEGQDSGKSVLTKCVTLECKERKLRNLAKRSRSRARAVPTPQ